MNHSLALNEPLPRSAAGALASPPKVRPSEAGQGAGAAAGAAPESLVAARPVWRGTERRRGVVLGVALLHLAVGWALAHRLSAPSMAPPPGPVQVRLLTPPPQAEPPAPVRREVQLPVVAPVPLIQPPVLNINSPVVVAVSEPAPVMAAKPAATAVAAAPARAAAAGPREIPPSAVHYLIEPQLHVPRMSRRLGESGTVVLHIVVDASGQLRSAAIKKSSGFERLDQQALQDIRTARFSPYLEKGQPIDWETDAGLQYEVR